MPRLMSAEKSACSIFGEALPCEFAEQRPVVIVTYVGARYKTRAAPTFPLTGSTGSSDTDLSAGTLSGRNRSNRMRRYCRPSHGSTTSPRLVVH
jgi:hypothetical protein